MTITDPVPSLLIKVKVSPKTKIHIKNKNMTSSTWSSVDFIISHLFWEDVGKLVFFVGSNCIINEGGSSGLLIKNLSNVWI